MIVCLLMLVVACGNSATPSGASRSPFLGGTSALQLEFERDAPPSEVTDRNFPFKVVLNIENQGEHDITENDIKIGLSGINQGDFLGVSNNDFAEGTRLEAPINGKKQDPEGGVIDGGIAFVTIPDGNNNFVFRQLSGNTPFTFQANVCYRYETKATGRLCILKNLFKSDFSDELCNPNSGRDIFSSSGPVQLSQLKQHVDSDDRITFSFDVSHSGSGELFKTENDIMSGCPRDNQGLEIESRDKVYVSVETRGLPFDPVCNIESGSSSGEVRLVSGSRTITCTLDLPLSEQRTDFESILDITVDYLYDQSIKKEVLVKHVGS